MQIFLETFLLLNYMEYIDIHFLILTHYSCRWKIHESCLLALGSVRNLFVDHLKKGKLQFDIKHFIESVILADMTAGSGMFPFYVCMYLDIILFSMINIHYIH